MPSQEALIRRVPKGGTCSIKGLARQLAYLSRQSDPDRDTVFLAGSQRHQFSPGTADAVDPNDVWAFARRLYERSGRLPPDRPDADLPSDLTVHFVISFPSGTDPDAAERAGRDWAEYVFGLGYRNEDGFVERHDYVTAFHRHDGEHPHMHVVVDRCPLGGGNLLTLHEGHPHWSYEAMRRWAVEAAANHGIELIATDWSEHRPADRPLTQAQAQELDRRLRVRPVTSDENERRLLAAANTAYIDSDFDAVGTAPLDDADAADQVAEDLRRGCTPIVLVRADPTHPSPLDDHSGDSQLAGGDASELRELPEASDHDQSPVSGGEESDGGDVADHHLEQLRLARAGKRRLDDDEQDARKRRRTGQENGGESGSGSSSARPIESETSQPTTTTNFQRLQRLSPGRARSGEDVPLEASRAAEESIAQTTVETVGPAAPRAESGGDGGAGPDASDTSTGEVNRARKRMRAELDDGSASKRQRTEHADSETTGRDTRVDPGVAPEQEEGDARSNSPTRESPGQSSSNPLAQRRRAANEARESAMDALHAHRRGEAPSGVNDLEGYRAEDRRLLSEARSALAEQRRAYAGMTNVETRAQAARRRSAEAERNLDGSRQEGRDSRADNSRSR